MVDVRGGEGGGGGGEGEVWSRWRVGKDHGKDAVERARAARLRRRLELRLERRPLSTEKMDMYMCSRAWLPSPVVDWTPRAGRRTTWHLFCLMF